MPHLEGVSLWFGGKFGCVALFLWRDLKPFSLFKINIDED